MTREEEILEASKQHKYGTLSSIEKNIENIEAVEFDSNDLATIHGMSFYEGAKWADRNPQSSWISVEEDLPCNNHNFIHFGFTNRVLVRNKNGDLFVAYMKKNKDNEWIWCNDTDDNFDLLSDITYWMPIPKLSKE